MAEGVEMRSFPACLALVSGVQGLRANWSVSLLPESMNIAQGYRITEPVFLMGRRARISS